MLFKMVRAVIKSIALFLIIVAAIVAAVLFLLWIIGEGFRSSLGG